jgi:ketosteroid isomerase-like protein
VSEHSNARRIRDLLAAFEKGDLATITSVIPEDAIWHFPGRRGKLAGSHVGREAILRFLLQVPALTGGTFHLALEHVIADDTHAAVFFRGSGERDGKRLDNPTVLRIDLRDGQAQEIWEYVWDLDHVEAFWS